MSIRTVIEINHDRLDDIEQLSHPELLKLIRSATNCNSQLNEGTGYGVDHGNGFKTLTSRHHTDRLRVIVQLNTRYDDGSPEHRDIKENMND